jgi:carbamoyl-phosphate synthase large subunit
MNILITGVGGPTPRSIARSLRLSPIYKEATLIGTDINPLAHGLYQNEL